MKDAFKEFTNFLAVQIAERWHKQNKPPERLLIGAKKMAVPPPPRINHRKT